MEGAREPRLRDFLSGSLATWVRVRWESWEGKRVSGQTEGWGRGGRGAQSPAGSGVGGGEGLGSGRRGIQGHW